MRHDLIRGIGKILYAGVACLLFVSMAQAKDVGVAAQDDLAVGEAQTKETQPNVLIILIDDMGYRDVGYHGSEIATPNIDRLAAGGAELTQFYAQPTCSPTRTSLMTGQSAVRLGVLMPLGKNTQKSLPLSERLMPEYFKDAGYQTALVGKWHVGHATRDMQPTSRGFDHFYGNLTGGVGHWDHVHGGGYDWQRNGETVREEGYTTHLLTDEAIKLIAEREVSKPFFMYLSYNAPHLPNEAPDETIQQYAAIENEHRRVHAAMVTEVDAGIGRVVEALKSEGVLDDTIIWFMSDNGGLIRPDEDDGNYQFVKTLESWLGTPIPILFFEFARVNYEMAGSDNTPFRKGKMSVYEGGVRVPSFLYWEGRMPSKKVAGRITVQDVLPTLVSAVDLPVDEIPNLDGADRWDLIEQGADQAAPDYFIHSLYGEAYYHGSWKLLVPESGEAELYNLKNDPTEQTNVIALHPEIAEDLMAKIDAEPRGDIVNPSILSVMWDPDFFGGEEDRKPWADVVRD